MKVALIYDHESELYYTHLYTNAIIQYNLVFVLFFFFYGRQGKRARCQGRKMNNEGKAA